MAKHEDLTGQRFGKVIVEEYVPIKNKPAKWKCICDCGNVVMATTQELKNGRKRNCGCEKELEHKKKIEYLKGRKFGKLTFLEWIPYSDRTSVNKNIICKCDCGNTVVTNDFALIHGMTKSCGCYYEEYQRNSHYANTHRKSHTRLYKVWSAMQQRCTNPNNASYHNYGGRGIEMCKEWLEDFQAFYDWSMANGYDENAPQGQCTIDRIDNDKGYSPDNCRWVPMKKQVNNKRTTRIMEYNGAMLNMSEWSRKLKIPYHFIQPRAKRGMNMYQIIEEYNSFN